MNVAANMSKELVVNGRLRGRTAIITGGANGIGRAAARMFAAAGARVAILDIQAEAGRGVVAEIEKAGGEAMFLQADASDTAAVRASLAAVVAKWGAVDTLFSHAGTIIVKSLHESTDSDYERLMNINVRSSFVVCREVVSHMLENGGGSIVITSSIGGEKGFGLESLYCMTKGAVLQLARSIAIEYRDRGIRANAVCPGFVKTAHGLREIDELDGLGQKWNEADLRSVQGRLCEPEEVAAAALWLASDEASFVNGLALYVDNGWYAKG
ncbi:short-chain dehydrogenase/reductase SDR (plasmid) [Rhizobium leguminosarum bv. trifolii WSM2304]|uniref:Short-chain dehydrogenase/reductase SDR n=1 Tax=Rhizobium leguminosarum bv. trifolii (strain WSM2304) TaxID=395492 RepID=A0ABF7QZD5_RHILW|nr:SDR family oxidoreductase [Rhizobium leguminosarum]ACI59549.1 short-chain dehydrogenase/reductase SDR [Rhizobium leguminosarum bv. trifolii WSM2304]